MLVSAAHDGTMLVWNLAALIGRPERNELSAADLKTLWDDLASPEAGIAGQVMRRLVDHPQQTGALLRAKLEAASVSKKEISRLLADLANEQFLVRENARKKLAELGELAEPALRALLEAETTLEQKTRAEKLLARLRDPITDGNKLRALRAVELLELVRTPAAVEVLRTLAGGAEDAYVTDEARAAFRRMKMTTKKTP
jgi:hypothetical protein